MHKYFAPPGGGRCPVTVDSTGQRAPHRARRSAMGLALATIAAGAAAQSHSTADARKAVELDPVEIRGHYDNSVGSSDAASGGVITPQLIEDRPLLRPGNLLEYVPGMVVTPRASDSARVLSTTVSRRYMRLAIGPCRRNGAGANWSRLPCSNSYR